MFISCISNCQQVKNNKFNQRIFEGMFLTWLRMPAKWKHYFMMQAAAKEETNAKDE
jgi:hypothetical protein